jgi:ligand-binding SRPBCC domain-containing protein
VTSGEFPRDFGFAIRANCLMPLITLDTLISAPIERVFDLTRSIDAHIASTHGTSERAIAGRTTGLIEAGETVTWEATHFLIRQRLTVRITDYDRPFLFRDEMLSGAFASMHHTHRFSVVPDGTLARDEFYFTAPLSILGTIAERLFLTRYMRTFLQRRARALTEIAESEDWRRFVSAVPA